MMHSMEARISDLSDQIRELTTKYRVLSEANLRTLRRYYEERQKALRKQARIEALEELLEESRRKHVAE